ncbi:hypothetical protein A6V25_32510 [Nostoc sp. ATCC 53789]|nr:hypothetical protein A6V25_32510 [Nostoc sp. ATCC 53789]
MQRGRGERTWYLNSPLLLCSPAQAQALRGVVRNPGVACWGVDVGKWTFFDISAKAEHTKI